MAAVAAVAVHAVALGLARRNEYYQFSALG